MLKRLSPTFGCPVELTVKVLAGKWKPVILAHLKEGRLRYSELRSRVPRLSDKVLTERLRALEQQGLVRRKDISGDRIYAVYELTERGNSLRPVLDALYAWGETAAADLGVMLESSSYGGGNGLRRCLVQSPPCARGASFPGPFVVSAARTGRANAPNSSRAVLIPVIFAS